MMPNYLWMAQMASQGVAVTPGPTDVCKTPSPAVPMPIPYPNIGMSSQAGAGKASKVKIAPKGSSVKTSKGDEAGTLGALVSAKMVGNNFATAFLPGGVRVHQSGRDSKHIASKVKLEGQPAQRAFDMMMQNHKNTMPMATQQMPVPAGALNSALQLHSLLKGG